MRVPSLFSEVQEVNEEIGSARRESNILMQEAFIWLYVKKQQIIDGSSYIKCTLNTYVVIP